MTAREQSELQQRMYSVELSPEIEKRISITSLADTMIAQVNLLYQRDPAAAMVIGALRDTAGQLRSTALCYGSTNEERAIIAALAHQVKDYVAELVPLAPKISTPYYTARILSSADAILTAVAEPRGSGKR